MIGRELDSNNDIVIRDGQLAVVSGKKEIVQHVRVRLNFFLGEWFLDKKAGTPYYEQILKKPANLPRIETIIKNRILKTPGVDKLISFKMQYEGGNSRKLTITFSAKTVEGGMEDFMEI